MFKKIPSFPPPSNLSQKISTLALTLTRSFQAQIFFDWVPIFSWIHGREFFELCRQNVESWTNGILQLLPWSWKERLQTLSICIYSANQRGRDREKITSFLVIIRFPNCAYLANNPRKLKTNATLFCGTCYTCFTVTFLCIQTDMNSKSCWLAMHVAFRFTYIHTLETCI